MSIQIRRDVSEQTLIQAAEGREASIPRGWAISQVASSGVREPAGLLRRILAKEGDDVKSRRMAASALWRLNTPEAREGLLAAAASVKEPRVLAGVVKLLGRVGDERALAAIERIKARGEDLLAEQAAFAAALIAHRLGLPGNDLPVPSEFEPLPPTDQRRMDFRPPPPEEVALFLKCLQDEPFEVAVSRDALQQIHCGDSLWMLALTEQFIAAGSSGAIQKQKHVVALLAAKNNVDGRYSVAFLVFSSPGRGRQAHLLVHRVTGEQAWAGSIEAGDSGEIRFALRTAGRVGIVPIELEGVWHGRGKIETSKALSSSRVSHKLSPVKVEPPRS